VLIQVSDGEKSKSSKADVSIVLKFERASQKLEQKQVFVIDKAKIGKRKAS
jgi:hypothetical protein